MGQYFYIVNPVKRQYINIGNFAGVSSKASGVLCGFHASAVAVLVCNIDELNHSYGPLAGSWSGDPVIAAGDYCPPDEHGIVTATAEDPQQNLYCKASEEFEDITYRALAMMCEGQAKQWDHDAGFAEELAKWAKESELAIVDLGNTVYQIGCEPLRRALDEIIGPEWVTKYEQAQKRH